MNKFINIPIEENVFALNTKESLVYLLLEKQPKKAKQLHRYLNVNNKRGITYQAIHKSLLDLVEKKILCSKNNKYTVNPQWIVQLKQICREFEIKRENKRKIEIIDEERIATIKLNGKVAEIYKKIFNYIFKNINNKQTNENKLLICQKRPFIPYKLIEKLTEHINKKSIRFAYGLTFSNRIDYANGELIIPIASKVIYQQMKNRCDIFIINDTILELEFSNQTNRNWEKISSDYSKIKKINLPEVNQIISNLKTNCTVKVNRNYNLAEIIREQIIGD